MEECSRLHDVRAAARAKAPPPAASSSSEIPSSALNAATESHEASAAAAEASSRRSTATSDSAAADQGAVPAIEQVLADEPAAAPAPSEAAEEVQPPPEDALLMSKQTARMEFEGIWQMDRFMEEVYWQPDAWTLCRNTGGQLTAAEVEFKVQGTTTSVFLAGTGYKVSNAGIVLLSNCAKPIKGTGVARTPSKIADVEEKCIAAVCAPAKGSLVRSRAEDAEMGFSCGFGVVDGSQDCLLIVSGTLQRVHLATGEKCFAEGARGTKSPLPANEDATNADLGQLKSGTIVSLRDFRSSIYVYVGSAQFGLIGPGLTVPSKGGAYSFSSPPKFNTGDGNTPDMKVLREARATWAGINLATVDRGHLTPLMCAAVHATEPTSEPTWNVRPRAARVPVCAGTAPPPSCRTRRGSCISPTHSGCVIHRPTRTPNVAPR